ncbi:MAG: hypothetical protein Q4D96_03145 [Propionibacteriaceae bacterium]|nr:hypothetical protein [Propionibacteriaceae bacterium]
MLLGLCGLFVVTQVVLSNAHSRSQIDLQRFVEDHDPQWPYLNAVDITATECPDEGCLQAVQSAHVSVLKFPSVETAAEFALSCDCSAIDPIVIRFDRAPVTAAVRAQVIDPSQASTPTVPTDPHRLTPVLQRAGCA